MRAVLFRCLFLLIVIVPHVQAADIPGTCMGTFNVKNTGFSSGNTTLSCVAVEKRRLDLFQRVNALPASGNVDGNELASRLVKLEGELKKQEDASDWKGMATTITGNFTATLGLATCLETLGTGCAVAVAFKVWAMYDVVDSAATDAKKKAEAARMRNEIATIRQKITTKVKPAEQLRNQLVADFVSLCNDVQKYCINK
jgi:hypothetical protein